jgi:hypothetical protein
MKQRFKNRDFNTAYNNYIKATPAEINNMMQPGSNRDQAFRDGFVNYRCKYQRNWILYPIYIAGKEWQKQNPSYTVMLDGHKLVSIAAR